MKMPDREEWLLYIAGMNIGTVAAMILIPRNYVFTLGLWIIYMIVGTSAAIVSKPNPTRW